MLLGRFFNMKRRTDIDLREITTDAFIIYDNKVLLVKRKLEPFAGMWALPGGHLNYDETVEEACVREVKEETNLDIRIVCLFGVFSNPDRGPYQRVTIVYEVACNDASGLKAGDDASEVGWFDFSNLPKLAFDHEEIIKLFLQR